MDSSQSSASAPQYKEVTMNRFIGAPREAVFKAWTDAAQLARWWGPSGFSAPRCEIDARPGGAIHIDMQGPDGRIYPMSGSIIEIDPPERLVFNSAPLDSAGQPLFEVLSTVVLAEKDGGTQLSLQAQVTKVNSSEADQPIAGMSEGWKQTIDRLSEFCTN
jgi:uncharacterized protein YndB with AHSA1/START domain